MNTNQTIKLANVKLLAGGQYQTYEDRLSITAVIDDKQKAEVLSQWPDITIKEKDGKNYLKIKCNVAGKFQVPLYDISKTTIFYQNAKEFVDKVERITPEQSIALCGRVPQWADEEPTPVINR